MSRVAVVILLIAAVPLFAAERMGKLEGKIVGRDAGKNTLEVDHGDVPGLMGAMTMSYEVRGAKVGALPPNGAAITAMLHEADGDFWLTDVRSAAAAMPMPMPRHETMRHDTPQHDMSHMQHGSMEHKSDPTADLLMRQASGTSMNPAAAPMHMTMWHSGDWMLMLHGLAFVNQVVQTGPRGDDKFFSTNWAMGMADRPLAGGHLTLRTMLSLEPATVGKKYPELFQTGETIDGRPIVDAQHPHDFFMELAAEYAHPISDDAIVYVYAAPHGDPALGPVAYPHRASASEIPQATLSHHVQDSTHIAASVLTTGAQSGRLGFGVSGFRGREPDEQRWNLESGKIDSWSARATYDPTPNWSAQISTGRLKHPEAAHAGDVQRTTASLSYSGPTSIGRLDSSVIFGRNDRTRGPSTSSWLAEGALQFGRNYVTGRGEIVDKDELDVAHDEVVRVRALTLGYSRELPVGRSFSAALGVNATAYSFPGDLRPFYGSSPHSFYLFARIRLGASPGMQM